MFQAFLGAKVHNAKDPASDLSAMLAQVVGSLFQETERNASVWQKVRSSEPVPIMGGVEAVSTEAVQVDVRRMVDSFVLGYKNLREIWALAIAPATMLELKKIAQTPPDRFRFPDETWVRVIYDFALSYRLRTINRDQLLRALTPLYLGRVASFVTEMKDAGPEQVKQQVGKTLPLL